MQLQELAANPPKIDNGSDFEWQIINVGPFFFCFEHFNLFNLFYL